MLQFAKPTLPSAYWKAFVGRAAVRLACDVGWQAELVEVGPYSLEIDCGGSRIVAKNYGVPAGLIPPGAAMAASTGNFSVQAPPELALRAFADAFGCSGGTAMAIAPVGRYASHVELGMIDAVAIPPEPANRDGDWPMDIVTVGHSRCWVVSATLHPARPYRDGDVAVALRRSTSIALPPPGIGFVDTAQLCEAMLDEGWASGLFPVPMVMSSGAEDRGNRIKGWIAATEASTIVAIAGQIGSRVSSGGSEAERRTLLTEAWKTTGHLL